VLVIGSRVLIAFSGDHGCPGRSRRLPETEGVRKRGSDREPCARVGLGPARGELTL
jgi:hypothetical protein